MRDAVQALSMSSGQLGVPEEVHNLRSVLFGVVTQVANAVTRGGGGVAAAARPAFDAATVEALQAAQRALAATTGGGVLQPGLLRRVTNPALARMRAVFMSWPEVFAAYRSHFFGLGLAAGAVRSRRLRYKVTKLFALGLVAGCVRRRRVRVRDVKVFALGVALAAYRHRGVARRAMKVLTLGLAAAAARDRRRRLRAAKMRALGVFARVATIRAKQRQGAVMFALGLGPCAVRTGGAPVGYKFKLTPEEAAARRKELARLKKAGPPAPKMRAIHWDTIDNVAGTVWAAPARVSARARA